MCKMTPPEIIKAIRTQLGLTQVVFAKELHAAFSTINRWENVQSPPNKMSRALLRAYAVEHGISQNLIDEFDRVMPIDK